MEIPKPGDSNIPLPDKDKLEQPTFTVLENADYLKALEDLIPQSKQRVWVQTMAFDGHGPFLILQDLLKNAAARGVDARFTSDIYYKLILSGSLYYSPRLSRTKREKARLIKAEKEDALSELEEYNVRVTVTNPPQTAQEKINPARGRNHIKMAIIDDIAFVGDINNFVSKDQPGVSIRITDPLLVEGLVGLYEAAERGRGGHDYEVTGRNDTSLLIDAGIARQSLILARAMTAIENAQSSVRMTSQFTPDGAVLNSLQSAFDRGLMVSTLIADPEKIIRPLPKMFDIRSQLAFKRAGFTFPILEVPQWIHAKILLVDEKLPTAQAIVGTHCFSGKGVDWGTQEASLQSRNPDLLNQLKTYVGDLEARAIQRGAQRTIRDIVFPK